MSTTTLAPENQASITVCRSEMKQRSAPLTWREFAQLATRDETSQQELWHGEVIDMPRPGYAHGKVLLRLSQLLANHLDAHPVGHAVSEVGLIVSEDTVLGPDLAFWTNERYPPESNCPRPGARYSRPDCRNSFSLRLSQPRDEENRNLPHGRRAAGLDCRPGNTLHNRVASQPARRYPDGQDSVVLFSDPNYWATKMAQGENRTSVGQ